MPSNKLLAPSIIIAVAIVLGAVIFRLPDEAFDLLLKLLVILGVFLLMGAIMIASGGDG